jgi:hypothetical protein
MRKHMTAVFEEALAGLTVAGDRVVYLGEDVRHGGSVSPFSISPLPPTSSAARYYLVTEGLAAKFPTRIHESVDLSCSSSPSSLLSFLHLCLFLLALQSPP